MNSNELGNKIKQFNELLILEMPRINESVAMKAYGDIRNRVVNNGVIGSGKSLGGYSNSELPLFFFKGKSLNAKGDKAIEKAKKENRGLSYKEFREAQGRPTDHVTLNFSGSMWKDIGVIKELVTNTKIITIVGAKNTINRVSYNAKGEEKEGATTDEIMEGNSDRYGDFLEVNKQEEEVLANTYDALIQDLIDKTFE